MQKENTIFLAIIIGAVIIGGGVYRGLKDSDIPCFLRSQKTRTEAVAMQSGKTDSITNANIAKCGAGENTIVTKIIDGDTVIVEGGYHVRLLGMDADEKGYTCYDQAKIHLESLVLLKQVRLEKDKTDLDQYGRCLRYVFIGDTNVNVQLVKEGLAVARFYEPDVKYKSEITEAEKQAQQSEIGCKWKNKQ